VARSDFRDEEHFLINVDLIFIIENSYNQIILMHSKLVTKILMFLKSNFVYKSSLCQNCKMK
jgi:hypothetical protein